jgi:nicotinamidase-related amidase
MLFVEDAVLVIVDVQGKLAQLMADKEELFANLERLVRGADVLELPILWLEQYPEGLGPTIEPLAALLAPARQPMPKVSFSCWGCPAFVDALRATGRRQVLLAGIETHVCIYQTTADLLSEGYEVQVVGDAVSSRAARNRELGLQRVRDLGAAVTTTEMALFELQRVARGDRFRALARIVR